MENKKRLLYIGNKLAGHGRSPSSADILPGLFAKEGHMVMVASDKRNKIFRLMHMVWVTFYNRKKIDLVLIDTYSTSNFIYAALIAALCRRFKLPYIPILHGGNLPVRLKNNEGLSKKMFTGAKTNVAPSRFIMEAFQKQGFKNIVFIPNSIKIDHYPFLLRKAVKPKLLWVRSFADIYNPNLALKIVEMLTAQGLEVELCMVGPEKDGALQKCRRMAEELNLPIKFMGLLPKKEWIAMASNFDIFINTSNYDNMPVSVMEAMALGLPVISTNVGGMPFLIESGSNGILVPTNRPDAFVEAIQNLYLNPPLVVLLSGNARASMENFDWKRIKNRWMETLYF